MLLLFERMVDFTSDESIVIVGAITDDLKLAFISWNIF